MKTPQTLMPTGSRYSLASQEPAPPPRKGQRVLAAQRAPRPPGPPAPHLGLHHVRPLEAEALHRLEHVQQPLRLHTLQDVAEGDERTGAPRTRAAGTEGSGRGPATWGGGAMGQRPPHAWLLQPVGRM